MIAGLVTTKRTTPVAGAFIRLLDQGKDFVGEVRSDGSGDFHFFAGPGEWTLVCLAPGAERDEQTIALEKGQELQVEFDLAGAPA